MFSNILNTNFERSIEGFLLNEAIFSHKSIFNQMSFAYSTYKFRHNKIEIREFR